MSLVDVAVTGHIGAPVYIAAIAVGGTMFNMLYWIFNFLRMGTSGLTATAFGASDREKEALVLWRSLVIGLTLGVLMIVLSEPICTVVLQFMDADDATAALAARYFHICIWGAPAVMTTYALAGWFVGMQDSKAALVMAVAANIINIAVSLYLVFVLEWKIEGVAAGTTIAQWAGAVCGGVIIALRFKPQRVEFRKIFERRTLGAFFKLNLDLFLRTCCLVAVTVWFTHAGALSGADILAANALLLQLFMLFSFFMDGFAYAGEALAGKYTGAEDKEGLSTLIKSLLRVGLGCAALFAILYGVAGEWFMGILAEDRHVVEVARDYLPWAIVLPLCGYAAFIWDGIFVGTVLSRGMLISMAIAIAVFFLLWGILHGPLGNSGLWLAFNAYLLTRGIAEHAIWHRRHRKVSGTISHSGSESE